MKKKLKIEDMTCVNCAKTIEKHLSKIQGVEEVKVSFTLKQAEIEFNEFLVNEEEIEKEIESLGYKVKKGVRERIKDFHILMISISGAVYFLLDMIISFPYSIYLQFIIATIVQIIGGYSFYTRAWKALKENVGSMDVLITLGTSGAYIYSILAFFGVIEGKPFFETSVFIIAFVRLGKYIEERAKSKALKGLFKLAHISMDDLKVIRNGKEMKLTASEIKKGDVLELKGGSIVPVDGHIIEGDCYVNESMLTGESIPVYKKERDKVTSGSLIESGSVKIKVEKTFKESYAFQLSKAISDALSKKPKIQRLADRISGYFVEAVVIISLTTFTLWFIYTEDFYKSLQFALAVLVVSCPCALGIATPLAITVGVNRALKKGIVIRDLSIFEKLPKVNVFIFDKTGTLTEGKMVVENVKIFDREACDIAVALESKSNHPIAKAVYEYCKNRAKNPPDLKECREIKGIGVECGEFIATKASFWGIENKNGYTLVGVGKKDKIYALFYISDKVRKEAREVVDYLRNLGIRVVLLTGDSETTASKVAKEVGIEEFIANTKPEDKLRYIEHLQSSGKIVSMVGDGINDSLALAKADVSFAVAEGTDMAKRVGDAILLDGIKNIPAAMDIAVKTLKRIKQNLFWAFVYNAVSIPVAAGLFSWAGILIKPEMAGAMMALSSLSVVVNSIRK